jgi:hypothetical protein
MATIRGSLPVIGNLLARPSSLALVVRKAFMTAMVDEVPSRSAKPGMQIRCRGIVPSDLPNITSLLYEGFRPRRTRAFWEKVLLLLSERAVPSGYPRYGYVLESDNKLVGVMLTIFSAVLDGKTEIIRCSVSSWYVVPEFRVYATMLSARALSARNVTYLNVSAAPHTWAILETQGYKRYASGRALAFPALSRGPAEASVEPVTAATRAGDGLLAGEVAMLRDHARFGCISVVCCLAGTRHPFVFAPLRKYGILPFAYLVYCRNIDSFARCAGPLGRFLAWRGIPMVMFDGDGRVPGVAGFYRDRYPKYFKGPHRPRIGDLAYTELTLFGHMKPAIPNG